MSKLGIDQMDSCYLDYMAQRSRLNQIPRVRLLTDVRYSQPVGELAGIDIGNEVDICDKTRQAITKLLKRGLKVTEETAGIKSIFKNIDDIVAKVYKPVFDEILKSIGTYKPMKQIPKELYAADKAVGEIRDLANDIYGTVAAISSVTMTSLTNPFMLVSLGIQSGVQRIGINASVASIMKILIILMIMLVVGGIYNFVDMIIS